tara:strand:+ start:1178 stop:1801 length:624 start_codon:yes stop_codon:yes gene_type:complete
MIRKNLFRIFYFPNLCEKINLIEYPWGWKSKDEINKIKNYKLLNNEVDVNDHELKYIHEYKIIEHCEDMYLKTYHSYINNYDFLNTTLLSPSLSNGLNYLRSKSEVKSLDKNIKIKNIELINYWIKYGNIKSTSKFLGYYNNHEIVREISAGMIGPEIQSIWDQKSVKQKIRLSIELENREDIFEFEKDLMNKNNEWQLCNINRIIV